MPEARLPSIAIGNGRLLVTSDHNGDILSACWPCVDSPNQLAAFHISPTNLQPRKPPDAGVGYLEGTNTSFGCTPEGLRFLDVVIDSPAAGQSRDVHVRRICGPHAELALYIVPEIDGRPGAQTVYWDENSEALLAFCRQSWLAVGSANGRTFDFHCGRRGDESSATHFLTDTSLPGERIAFRSVDAALLFKASTDEEGSHIISAFGHTREDVLASLHATRDLTWESIGQLAQKRDQSTLSDSNLRGWSDGVNKALQRSSLVFDLLTNRNTGGVIAGPDVQSGIESAPGYAAVWGRDAAWTLMGMLSLGHITQAKRVLEFARATQSPEGLWLHRHHTDYSLASSWGLHQIDETGILLYSFACYQQASGDLAFIKNSWSSMTKAADFLLHIWNGKEFMSVDLWEEREGCHLYTVASTIAGIRAAALLAGCIGYVESEQVLGWTEGADALQSLAIARFWNEDLSRFVSSVHISPALPMVDQERPELSAKVQSKGVRPATALPQYPNWRSTEVDAVNYNHDISVLSMAVPFEILPVDDFRVVSSVENLRRSLWNHDVGGLCRYEGDSYGGGNPWPLATLWLAIYEGARGNMEECRRLVDWVVTHTTSAGLVPEQVHRTSGKPVAAVPLSWSHGMIAMAVAAANGQNVWRLSPFQ